MILFKWISIFLLAMILVSSCGKAPATAPTAPSSSLPAIQADGTSLIWRNDAEPCETALFTLKELSYGPCSGTLARAPTGATTATLRLSQLVNTFASFTTQTEVGKVEFKGKGSEIATAAEQRAIAEWAKLEFQVAQAGRKGAAWGLAFAWQREGGIAGFCDDVSVYLTGMVIVSNCKGLNGQYYLTASQLEHLFEWVDGLKNIDYYYKDPGVADAMSTRLVFSGAGQKNASAEVIHDINTFAASLLAHGIFVSQAAAETKEAEKTLRNYLSALNNGDYILAAKLYGGDDSLLQTWNPDISNNLPGLLKRACMQNGLMCLLPRSITYHGLNNEGGYQFYVEFNDSDGSLFHQGPCCRETSGVRVSEFIFRVVKAESGYQVMDLPPYVP